MNSREALEYLESVKNLGIVPGLDSVRELCRRLGDPQDRLVFVQIAGTNGKGSTLAYLSNILRCAGYRVGKFSSPAVFEAREGIQVGRRKITQEAYAQGLTVIRRCCEEMTAEGFAHPTVFEIETALAFWYFQREHCDVALLETGMGGALDATNLVCTTLAAVLTPIGMDHMQYLGGTLQEIAKQKAGIIKPGCRVVSASQEPEAMQVIEEACREKGCALTVATREAATHVRYGLERQTFDYGGLKRLEITLAGKFQIENAVLALEAAGALGKGGFSVSERALRQGLKETVWKGRFSVIGRKPLFILDGAHNEPAAKKLAQSIEFYFTNRRILYIIGILKDKEYQRIISLTEPYADQIITVTPPDNPRAMHAYELARAVAKVHPNVTAVDSLEEAVEMSYLLAGREDVIIAFGSLSYLGKMEKIVKKYHK